MPWLLALILIDVAVRRIAWDWAATKHMAVAAADYVRQFTMTIARWKARKCWTASSACARRWPSRNSNLPPTSRPTPRARSDRAKFEAGEGVEGDITAVVGGAVDKPIPAGAQENRAQRRGRPWRTYRRAARGQTAGAAENQATAGTELK